MSYKHFIITVNCLQTSCIIFSVFVSLKQRNFLQELELEDADDFGVRDDIFISQNFNDCIRVAYVSFQTAGK